MTAAPADAAVELRPYDPRWPVHFEAERRLLEAALQPWLAGPIEHIGSTAVPGLPAKPVIDILAPLASLAEAGALIDAVRGLHYLHHPYKRDEMLWFCKPSPAQRTHHLHVVEAGGSVWRQRLALRDALRGDASLAAAYTQLKRRLADRHRHDREAYTDGKAPFIASVLKSLLAAPLQLCQIGAHELPLMHGLLQAFGEAFEDLPTYTGRRPGDDYLRRLLAGDNFIALAALDEDTVVGGLTAYELPKYEQQRSEIYLYDLAVRAAYRRQGIASALIERLKALAIARGAWVVFVQADTGPEDQPAIALYDKLGRREEVLHFDIALPAAPGGGSR